MVVVRGVLVPFSGIWNAVYRHTHGRGGRGLPVLELRGTMYRGDLWMLPEDGWSAQPQRYTLEAGSEPCVVLAPGDSHPVITIAAKLQSSCTNKSNSMVGGHQNMNCIKGLSIRKVGNHHPSG